MQDLEPARALRLADHDVRHIVGLRVAEHFVGDVPVGGQRDGFAAERLGEPQRVGNAVALDLRKLQAAPPFDIERRPRSMQPVGEPLGVAHEPGRARILADAYQDALAGRPRTLDGARLHFREQLLVNPLGGAAQSQSRAAR